MTASPAGSCNSKSLGLPHSPQLQQLGAAAIMKQPALRGTRTQRLPAARPANASSLSSPVAISSTAAVTADKFEAAVHVHVPQAANPSKVGAHMSSPNLAQGLASSSAIVVQPGASTSALTGSECEVSANEMSKSDLQLVTRGCVQFLQRHVASCTRPGRADTPGPAVHVTVSDSTMAINIVSVTAAATIATNCADRGHDNTAPGPLVQVEPACAPVTTTVAAAGTVTVADHVYMAYLVTALLCLCMAPRSQVLRQLRIGSSLIKEADGRYWVRLLADMCKNGKPTLFAIPEILTPAVDYYLTNVRPRMVARQQSCHSPAAVHVSEPESASGTCTSIIHDYVFCKNNGAAPRADFSTCTNLVTWQIIGRSVNAHAFRAAVITTFYGANASQADMETLAAIMSHDSATARNYYFRPEHMRAAEDTAQRMMEQLLPAEQKEHCQP